MNILWFAVLRPLYALGLLFVTPLFFLVLAGGVEREPDVAMPVLLACAGYFAFSLVVFGLIPRRLRSRLMARVHEGRPPDFEPACEVVSVLNNRYLAIDSKHGQAYFVDCERNTGVLMKLDEIDSWVLVEEPRKPGILTLVSRLPSRPAVGIHLHRGDSARIAAQLGSLAH